MRQLNGSFVYQFLIALLLVIRALSASAQPDAAPLPQPDLLFIVVENAHGRPMRGIQAESREMVDVWRDQGKRAWTVRQQFRISDAYPYGPEKPGDPMHWTLQGTRIPIGWRTHYLFAVSDCYCTDLFVEVERNGERMRIDLPTSSAERWALLRSMQQRSTDHASPEVFRFRPGRFTFAELATDPAFDRLEARIARHRSTDPDQPYRDRMWRGSMAAWAAYFSGK